MAAADFVEARLLSLATREGVVFGDLEFTVPRGGLGVITGPSGSGRSALLLTLAGRMPGWTGALRVGGHDAARESRAVRRISAVARIGSMIDLEPRHTVGEAITERALIDGMSPRAAGQTVHRAARELELRLADDTLVERLPAVDRTILAVLLATVRPAELVIIDDVDRGLDAGQQARVWSVLDALTADHTTVLASTVHPETVPDAARLITLDPVPSS
ncbi:ATP-binding cassette domain-containing protein [Microlunatus speluncae]|uniref:ATP-binding cassette domain-containing protein n=1 Tax=Microlunatus speluncae TaxID=2594267 RepID=UPI0013763600|nr:ATP-binding cassette domain-containing protein [Microlunatus speluncae]